VFVVEKDKLDAELDDQAYAIAFYKALKPHLTPPRLPLPPSVRPLPSPPLPGLAVHSTVRLFCRTHCALSAVQ
jgi:hypothetical protein